MMNKKIIKKFLGSKLRNVFLIVFGILILYGIYLFYYTPVVFYSLIYTIQSPQDTPYIRMNVPERIGITDEGKAISTLEVLNPTNTAIVICDCFYVGKVSNTNEQNPHKDTFVGYFEKEDTSFIIDFDNISKGPPCRVKVLLKPNQHKKYKFIIKNAEGSKYRIKMGCVTIDLVYDIQGFGVSNIFETYEKSN
ncbi:MAG: hypothetical protein U9R21_04965 [Candidatus Thermoplasmatota archaeon]|nr:hypothetical protein [Candidatus Thermoplasmatota archaeon]